MSYSGFQLCEQLKHGDVCIRVKIYDSGSFNEVFHDHIPSIRLSQEHLLQALKSLVLNNTEIHDETLLHSYLNNRSKEPPAIKLYRVNVEYPEKGVKRTYCSSGGVTAWVDEVISKSNFRENG